MNKDLGKFLKYSLAVSVIYCLVPMNKAQAACLEPAGVEGEMIYNTDHKIPQYCDNTNWVALGGGAGGTGGGYGMTQDMIVAFEASSCPSGWSEYVPARGRFLRGIDPSGTNDVTRIPGNIQLDALQGHRHGMQFSTDAPRVSWGVDSNAGSTFAHGANGGGSGYGSMRIADPIADESGNGTPRIANETRPKNVAVIYCKYTGGGGAPGGTIGTTTASYSFSYNTYNSVDGSHDWRGPGTNFRNCQTVQYFETTQTIQNTEVNDVILPHVLGSNRSTWHTNAQHAKYLRDFDPSAGPAAGNASYGHWAKPKYGPSKLSRCQVDNGTGAYTIEVPVGAGGAADNLGNHTATENIKLGTNYLSGDGDSEGVFVAANGNVGIGTDTPGTKLQVKEGQLSVVNSTNNTLLHLKTNSTNSNKSSGIYLENIDKNYGIFLRSDNSNSLSFCDETIGKCRMVIASGGNVGIGTTSPGSLLHVSNKTGLGALTIEGSNSMISALAINTHGNGSAIIGSANARGWLFEGKGSGWSNATHREDFFLTYWDGAAYQERLFIDSITGNVGISTPSPSYKLHVNGTAYATGAAGNLSDARHKKNVQSIDNNALDRILRLRPVSYEWIDPIDKGMEGKQLGFIAQEVETILPEVVITQDDEEKTKGLKSSEIIPVLVKAIQELDAKHEKHVQDLKSENEALKKEIEKLKSSN
jgi:hypothetical protein